MKLYRRVVKPIAIKADSTEPEAIRRAIRETKAHFGGFRI